MSGSVPEARVVAILQARLGSTRLPGKVLADLGGQPMLGAIIDRLLPMKRVQQLVVATTLLPADDAIEQFVISRGVACFRGAEVDCLDRYYQAALRYKADIIVRLTADNPLVEASFVDWVVEQFLAARPQADYTNSTVSKGFPLGMSVEVFTSAALASAWRETADPAWREHVTPFIHRNPDRFRLLAIASPQDYAALRWTVDTPEDLAFVRRIYDHFGGADFSWLDVPAVLEAHPEWSAINSHIEQKLIV